MKLKTAFVLSLLLHLLVVLLLTKADLLPPEQKQRMPLIAEIITPERAEEPPLKGSVKGADRKSPLKQRRKSRSDEKPPSERLPKREGRVPDVKEGLSLKGGQVHEKSVKRPVPSGKLKKPSRGKGMKSSGVKPVKPEGSIKTEQAREEVRLPKGKELFDTKIIEEIARNKSPEEEREGSGITFSTKELKHYSYMMKLKGRIERIWKYPIEAVRRGAYGDLYIRFTIKKDGYLGAVELIRTSGYRELDEAAIKALKDGEPYWPLPEKWNEEAITITGHFIYTLYGTYLR